MNTGKCVHDTLNPPGITRKTPGIRFGFIRRKSGCLQGKLGQLSLD
ncbi:hypothetical protein STM14_3528 [Salmonella enterica subsp. enterica serovar Typhimurium str. 14028S]|uniref:Uncharacterized protein n=3 Tax=Salmonella enterica I TaxID=59201 RepID=M7RPT1_SALDU|nr:hypothetical protein SPAB_03639 [Salmonella enterica subsp. enterica serovar Paratyphi B str. SPB7]ACY89941.1 hypothetical protein STM14_3528 [Salmonella enterica subsp. enterica serovar Typhimurium str. 14028S]EMR53783.1 hypothetical protein A670_00942 [Salmonella enterica subsp. enterica serovar Dublin str. UC16]